jgi:hypothetical protein
MIIILDIGLERQCEEYSGYKVENIVDILVSRL